MKNRKKRRNRQVMKNKAVTKHFGCIQGSLNALEGSFKKPVYIEQRQEPTIVAPD